MLITYVNNDAELFGFVDYVYEMCPLSRISHFSRLGNNLLWSSLYYFTTLEGFERGGRTVCREDILMSHHSKVPFFLALFALTTSIWVGDLQRSWNLTTILDAFTGNTNTFCKGHVQIYGAHGYEILYFVSGQIYKLI